MKRTLSILLLLAMVVFLAACGGDDDGDSNDSDSSTADDTTEQTDNSAQSDASGFTATLTDAVDGEITGNGYFQCEPEGFGEWAIGASGGFTDNVLILVPRDAEAGTTYTIVSDRASAEQAVGTYIGEDLQTAYYDSDASGTITLDTVPSETGDTVAGNFEFTVNNDNEETVTVVGSFDFEVGANAFFNCENE